MTHTGGFEEEIWLPDLQVLKEDAVELVVVILPRVDQHVIQVPVQCGDDTGQPDDLRACAKQRNDFHWRNYAV